MNIKCCFISNVCPHLSDSRRAKNLVNEKVFRMEISEKIKENLAIYNTKLNQINGIINSIMKLPRKQRNYWYLSFLYKEREVYEFATEEMEKINKENV